MRHEAAQEMRIGPSEPACRSLASNHLKLLWSNARVVSVKEKAPRKVSGEVQGGERKRTTDEVSK